MHYFGNSSDSAITPAIIAVLQGFVPAASAVLKEGTVDWVIQQLSTPMMSAEVNESQLDETLLVVALRHHWLKQGNGEGFSLSDTDGTELNFVKGMEWVTHLQGASVLTPETLERGLQVLELLGVLEKVPDISALADVVEEGEAAFCV